MSADPSLVASLSPLIARVRTDVSAVKQRNGKQAWTREPITNDRLKAHCNGGPARGVCPIKAGEDVTMVALLDLDSHKGDVPWPEMIGVAQTICAALELFGLEPIPWRSSGGSGIHIFMLWDEPQDAYSVRQTLIEVLAGLGYANGTGGVLKRQIEVFPKQDSVPADGFGNQFVLPLAGDSAPIVPSMGWIVAAREYAPRVLWPASSPVAPRERPVRPVVAVGAGDGLSARFLAALAAIPNEKLQEQDYDTWRNIIFAIHAASGGSEDGRAAAHAFSARASKYDPDFLDERVWPYVRQRDGGVTEQTVYALAREHGFDAVTGADFDAAPERPPTGPVAPVSTAPAPIVRRDGSGMIFPEPAALQGYMRRPDMLGWAFSYDAFTDTLQVSVADEGWRWRPFADEDYEYLRIRFQQVGFKPPSTDGVRTAAAAAAKFNRRDSAIEWGRSLTWDGVPRVETAMVRYFGCEDTPYSRAVGRYLFTALAARLMEPGAKVDMIPVLVGPQGSRKTSGVTLLAPWQSAFCEVPLDKLDENLSRRLRGRLVGELGELRGLASRDAGHIKEWITRTFEDWVPKYKEFASQYPRRVVFIGTSNPTEFLDDPTGERRWLPINSGAVDTDAIAHDRDQLWAEGIARWHAAGVEWGDAERLAKAEHEQFKVVLPWLEAVRDWLGRDDMDGAVGTPRGARGATAEEVLTSALSVPLQKITRREQHELGRVFRTLNMTRKKVRVGNHTVWKWFTPQVKGTNGGAGT